MRKSPVTVQQWVDTLPTTNSTPPPSSTPSVYSSPLRCPLKYLPREESFQSDDGSSHCSSVESVLELRKPDPEAVLLGLGFGPSKNSNILSRIPPRFLQPSKLLPHLDINKFLEQYADTKYNDQSAPPSPTTTRPKTS